MTSPNMRELDNVLGQMTQNLETLVDCMKIEREAIVEFNLLKLNETLRQKEALVTAIRTLEKAKEDIHSRLVTEAGLKAGATLETLLVKLSDPDTAGHIRHRVSCVRSLAQAAQEFNEMERHLIACSLNHVQESLLLIDRLSGRAGQGYDRNGVMGLSSGQKFGAVMNRTA